MFRDNEQSDLLNVAFEAARATISASIGADAHIHLSVDDSEPRRGNQATINIKPRPLRFDVEVKAQVSVGYLLSIIGRHPDLLLVTARLSPGVVETCRRFGVACIDVDGNVYLRWADSVIDVQGRPRTTSREMTESNVRGTLVTGRSGLQLLFVLLAFPDLIDAPVRALADAAMVSVGSVSAVLRELRDTESIRDVHGRRRLSQTRRLVDVFVDGYERRLFKRLSLGLFRATNPTWWENADSAVSRFEGQWGGESALWIQHLLRPARGIIYTEAISPRLIAELRMTREPADSANAEIRRRFWRVASDVDKLTVPPLLVYADLIADGDPRLLEAAARLRQTSPALQLHDD